MNFFLKKYLDSAELHVPEYGDSFLKEMLELLNKNKISSSEAINLIQCLTDIDEIRILLASEIRELIITIIMEQGYSDSLLFLLHIMCEKIVDCPKDCFKLQMQNIIYDILDGKLTVQVACGMIL